MRNILTAVLTKTRSVVKPIRTLSKSSASTPYTELDFDDINRKARLFADHIEQNFDKISDILLQYESYEVVRDEVDRTLDLLRNLHENKQYFQLRVNEVAAFLPRNQPLYAFACFIVVPSLMANKVHFRVPHGMKHFFPELLKVLKAHEQFPNILVSNLTRLEFLRARSALRVDPVSGESMPATDVVIFTGTSVHADQLRKVFDKRTLFISNGSGHNPVVVSKDAGVTFAADAVLDLQLYNQGQDCSAPNAVLVHKDIFSAFCDEIHKRLPTFKIGQFKDKSNRVGPICNPKDIVRIQDFLIENREWLDPRTEGIIHSHDAIIEPTIIRKPLSKGGNYTEIFAPIIFIQMYENDADLAHYFESPHYARNAMFITLYGTSKYVDSLVHKKFVDRILHTPETILRNKHPHADGVERGTQAYGGYGRETSSISINGKIMPQPALAQRDIYDWVAKPILEKNLASQKLTELKKSTQLEYKNVEKLLRLIVRDENAHNEEFQTKSVYIDLRSVKNIQGHYFANIPEEDIYRLLDRPNADYISYLLPSDVVHLRKLYPLLQKKSEMNFDDFKPALYAIPAPVSATDDEKKVEQRKFFQHIYLLLFGKKSGPRLAQFFTDIKTEDMRDLLDV